jgi:uncharacterized membrane protein
VENTPPGWVITYEFQNLEVDRIIVPPQDARTLAIKIRTPYEAEAGSFSTDVVLRDSGGNDNTVTVLTKVIQLFDIDLKCSQVHQVGTPGGFITYPMTLENLGNGHDIVALGVLTLPDGWNYNFKDLNNRQIDTIELDYGSKVDFKMNVWVSNVQPEIQEQLVATVQSSLDPTQQDQVQLTAEVRMPDLKIQSVEFNPPNIKENNVVQIQVLLQNVGTGGANDVVVEFYDNGKYIAEDEISYITTGLTGNATAVFTWLPKAGTHKLKFIVDPPTGSKPTGRVLESIETNNVLEVKKSVKEDSGLPGPSAPLALLGILVAVGIAATMGRRRRM